MIKNILSIAFITVALSSQAQMVQNPSFELWTTTATDTFPANWGSLGQMFVGANQPNPKLEVQTSVSHWGTHAILLQNQNVNIVGGMVQGQICTGPITLVGGIHVVRGRQAFSGQPVTYDFWYQFNALSGDTAGTQCYFTKWNTVTSMRDTIGYGGAYIVGAASVYTHMGVLINWTQTYAPDSIQLLFNSSIKGIGAPAVGGKLYIDDVIMSSTNGIEQVSNNASFLAFPNPASNSIRISSENEHARYLTVYDVTGRILDKYEFFNKTVLADVQSYSNGLYVYAVTDDRNNLLFTAKFSVAR